jgi:UDP-2,4-diacetamido-2,4,6-trideoxy-beta-L-altropyranose hydrolase
MGTGHVMRCLALAQAWQDAGGQAVFAMADVTPAIQARLASESCEVARISSAAGASAGNADDASQTITLAQERRADWIAVDGYQFNADYQAALHGAGFKVLFFDDYSHADHYSSDLVLNQNVHASESMYSAREPYTRLLLGPRYCLLRREFGPWRSFRREVAPVGRKILITMGGSDPDNLTARVIEALRSCRFQNLKATVVVGGSNPHFIALQSLAAESMPDISVRRDVSNMAEFMADVDVAVSAAGSTCWELCLLGLPALLIDVAHNQTALARELDLRGCAIYVGDHTVGAEKVADQLTRLLESPELRQLLSQRSRELVDGDGARRVVSVLRGRDLREGEGVRLRRARAEDSRLLWEWANDPEVRSASFSSDPIAWETHTAWFSEKLKQNGSLILIAENEGMPCGQIRFDQRPDGEWEVDVNISKAMRGQGLARGLIGAGVQTFRREHHNGRIHAFTKPSNAASARAFEKAGFKRIGAEEVRSNAAIHFVYPKSEPV